MYKKINLNNYDFLWSVGGMHYLFTSFWLYKEYTKRDFIACSENDFHTFYISKKQRKILSRVGLALFHKKFKLYEDKIQKQLMVTKKFFSVLKTKNIDTLSDEELAQDFKKSVHYWQKIWSQYFWTECFLQDRVTQVVEKGDMSFNLREIRKNINKMAKLKYRQRQYLNQTFYKGGLLDKYLKAIANRLNLGKELKDYHYKEVVDLLVGKKVRIPDRTIVVKGKFSNWEDILGNQAKKIIHQLQVVDYSVREIKGSIGNRGYHRGIVKKIDFSLKTNFAEAIDLMKKGDILVSGSTGPEMILACKKAGAIVTDEGGITSHAALVSRELGIPCIIGTKIATKVLKDGDIVEVDANKGLVRIIK